jgi:hypothetical protein
MIDDITIGTSLDTNKPFKVDANSIIMGRSLIASVTRYGKSYTNRRLTEQLFGKAGIVIVDPEGEFSSLRTEFPFVIIGKDVPLQVETAEFLAETTLKEDLSVIIDLSLIDVEVGKEFVSRFINHFMFTETTLKKPYWFVIEEADEFCLTEDTEVLTRTGWKTYENLKVGEHAAGFSIATGHGSYQPIQKIIIMDCDEDIPRLKSKSADFLMTPEHRAVYATLNRNAGHLQKEWSAWKMRETKDLPKAFKIPSSFSDWKPLIQNDYSLDADLVELAAWLITEGSVQHSHGIEYFAFYQSLTANKEKVERIRSLRLPFRMSESVRTRRGSQSVEFHLGTVGTKIMKALLSEGLHRIPRDWLIFFNKHQLSDLYRFLMLGDGTKQKYETRISKEPRERDSVFYAGTNQGLADDFQELCAKIGITAIIGGPKRNIRVNLSCADHCFKNIRKQRYTGKVWDIRVPTGAFLARRNGKPFITGNCPERGVAKATSLEALKNLAKKGGKRGIGLMITTHRPAFVSKMVLSQCTTLKLIGRIEWDSDLDVIKEFLQVSPLVLRRPRQNGKPTSDGLPHVDSLEPGQFYIGGSAVEREGFVKVGAVKTKHLGATPDIVPSTPKALAEVVKRLSASLPQIIAQKLKPTVDIEAIRKEVETKANAKTEKEIAAFKRKLEAENQSTVLNLRNEVKALTERLDTASRAASLGAAPITDPFEHPIVTNTMTKLTTRAQQLLMKIERQPGLNREQLAAFLTSSKDVVVNVIGEVNRTFKAEVIVDDGGRPVKYKSMLQRLYIQDVGKREINRIQELQNSLDKMREAYDDLRERHRVLESESLALKETLKHRPTYEELAKLQERGEALTAELKQSALQLKKQEQTIKFAEKIFSTLKRLVNEADGIFPVFQVGLTVPPGTDVEAIQKELEAARDGSEEHSGAVLPEKTSSQSTDAKIDVPVTLVERLDFTLREKMLAFLQKHPKTWFREQELAIALGDGKLFHETFLSLKDCSIIEMSEQGVRSK